MILQFSQVFSLKISMMGLERALKIETPMRKNQMMVA